MDNPWREVITEWQGGSAFIGRNSSGGSIQIGMLNDQPGLSSMELLLADVGGCTGVDIANILQKKRQPLINLIVRVRGKRADTSPKIYTEIEVTYLIWGDRIDPKAVEDAIRLSEEKYCSASAMLRAVAKISSSYRILLPGQNEDE